LEYQSRENKNKAASYQRSGPFRYSKERTWNEYKQKLKIQYPRLYDNHRNLNHLDALAQETSRENLIRHSRDEQIFSYDANDEYGPQNWNRIDNMCNGNRQSPIALDVRNATIDATSKPLLFTGFYDKPLSMKIENNGHSVKFTFNYSNPREVTVSGGPLKTAYILDSFHWHWAGEKGSEHTLNGKRYAAEIHLVTYNSIYNSLAEATRANGIAVVAFLYKVSLRLQIF
jgi:carbonic anhydrase